MIWEGKALKLKALPSQWIFIEYSPRDSIHQGIYEDNISVVRDPVLWKIVKPTVRLELFKYASLPKLV